MNYNLLLVDVGREFTLLHRMDVINGDYLNPARLNTMAMGYSRTAIEIMKVIIRDRPTKIIFDKNGVGLGLYETFSLMKDQYKNIVEIDAFGTIYHKSSEEQDEYWREVGRVLSR